MTPKLVLLKLALRAAERGDAEGAAEALRGVLAMGDDAPRAEGELRAISMGELAEMLGCTPEHISHLVKRGEIPPEAVLGRGRGTRIIVNAALEALRRQPQAKKAGDSIEAEGAEYVRRRSTLRVVRGSR